MKAMDNNVIIISTEPLIHIVAADNASYEEQLRALEQRNDQFQAIDMLCGNICPELGGRPEYLDIVGVNFYHSNQWTYGTSDVLQWIPNDRHEAWMPLNTLLCEVYSRYGRQIIITETSHPGEKRGSWLEYVVMESKIAIERNIPLLGICIYPIIDRPDWDEPNFWHHSGLWDAPAGNEEPSARIIHQPMADVLIEAQHNINTPCLTAPVGVLDF